MARVVVTPASTTLDAVGQTVRFHATARDQTGSPVEGVSFAWSSTDPDVASVDSTGLATARSSGSAGITAEARGASDRAELTVAGAAESSLVRSFAGLSGAGHPPDVDLAVGPDRVVAVTNGDVAIFDGSGERIASRELSRIFREHLTPGAGAADPRIVYDPNSERYFFAAMTHNKPCDVEAGECVALFLLAVSRSPSPGSLTGADWHIRSFPASTDPSAAPVRFPDFPRIGVTRTAVVVVGQMVHLDVTKEHQGGLQRLRIFDKARLVAGDDVEWTDFDEIRDGETTGAMIQPVKVVEDAPHLLFVSRGSVACGLRVWALRNPLDDPTMERAVVPGSDLDASYSCGDKVHASQPGSAQRIETGGRNTLNAQAVLRGGSLWVTHSVEVQGEEGPFLGVRWAEIGVDGWPGATETIRNEVIDTPGSHLYYPAVAANASGRAVLVYGRSGDDEHPSVHYRMLRAADTGDGSSAARLLKAGRASLTMGETLDGAIRFGDYFGAALDPTDGTFWISGEFAKTSSVQGSWIGNVSF